MNAAQRKQLEGTLEDAKSDIIALSKKIKTIKTTLMHESEYSDDFEAIDAVVDNLSTVEDSFGTAWEYLESALHYSNYIGK